MLPQVRAELTIEVARMPEDVFAYLTNVSNLPAWQSGVHTAQIEDAGAPRIGARIRESRHMLGRELNMTLEITEYDAPRLFSLRALDSPVPFIVRHELEPAVYEREEVGVDDVRRLEADLARELLGERADHAALRLHELDALDRARGFEIAEIREELHALLVDEQRCVRALEAGQVDDVLGVRDEERLLDQCAEAFDASVHAFSFRYSRAIR